MSRSNRSKYALLGALSLGPKSGYDIRRFFAQSVGNFWQESYGQIYPLLGALVADGAAEEIVPPPLPADTIRRGRDRRVYAITDRGRAQLARWVAEPAEPSVRRIEILLKLFFARQGDGDAVRSQVEAFRDAQRAQLVHYAQIAADLAGRAPGTADLPYWRISLDYGRRSAEALVAWADATLDTLATLERAPVAPSVTEHAEPTGAAPDRIGA